MVGRCYRVTLALITVWPDVLRKVRGMAIRQEAQPYGQRRPCLYCLIELTGAPDKIN
jgi:hypothetical protein